MHLVANLDPARDVPEHLRQYLTVVEDPRDIYTEQRRLSDQRLRLIYRRFLNQITYGCKNPRCEVPTCLSYRKRVLGGVVRPFTDVSAKALATKCVEEYATRGRDLGRYSKRERNKSKSGSYNDGLCWNEPAIPWYTHPDEHIAKANAARQENGHALQPSHQASAVDHNPLADGSASDYSPFIAKSNGHGEHPPSTASRNQSPKQRMDPASFTQHLYLQPEVEQWSRPLSNPEIDQRHVERDIHTQQPLNNTGRGQPRLPDRSNALRGKQKESPAVQDDYLPAPSHDSQPLRATSKAGVSTNTFKLLPASASTYTFKLLPASAVDWLKSQLTTPDDQPRSPPHPALRQLADQSLFFVLSDPRRLISSAVQWGEPELGSDNGSKENVLPSWYTVNDVCADLTFCVPGQTPVHYHHILKAIDAAFLTPVGMKKSTPAPHKHQNGFLSNDEVANLVSLVAKITCPLGYIFHSGEPKLDRQTGHTLYDRMGIAVATALSFRISLDLAAKAQKRTLGESKIVSAVIQRIGMGSETEVAVTAVSLVHLMQEVLVDRWDRNPIIRRSSPAAGALEMLLGLYHSSTANLMAEDAFEIKFLRYAFDEIEMPHEWLRFRPDAVQVHILQYPFLFPITTLVWYFRSLNFKLMKLSHEKAMGLYANAKAQLVHSHWQARHMEEVLEKVRPHLARYFVMTLRRDHALEDAMGQIWHRERQELTRPLRVKLGHDDGEEGLDHGGVQQEVFRLIFAEAFDEKYGLFITHPTTHMTWFNPASVEPLYKYEALGVLMSLAVYNAVTVPVTMPLAFYRKILRLTIKTTCHIRDGWPDLAQSFDQLLAWDEGDVADAIGTTYEFTYDNFGKITTIDMSRARTAKAPGDGQVGHGQASCSQTTAGPSSAAAGGTAEAPFVTNKNRRQFVKDYISHLTDLTIRAQFDAFLRGLHTLLSAQALALFTPTALKQLVEGLPTSQPLDLRAWQAITEYDNGYTASSPMITWFWDILEHDFTQEQLRSLLAFVTASDRLPVGGWTGITFVIQKNGDESDGRLPTSATCYGKFLLPEYGSREILKDRLEWAVGQAWGFWMV